MIDAVVLTPVARMSSSEIAGLSSNQLTSCSPLVWYTVCQWACLSLLFITRDLSLWTNMLHKLTADDLESSWAIAGHPN